MSYRAYVITSSDSGYAGEREDISGPTARKMLEEVGDGLKAIGIRAHYFNPGAACNRFPVTYAEEMEEPFETIIQFRYAQQSPDSPSVWWRLPKDKRSQQFPPEMGIAPENVLLLYQ